MSVVSILFTDDVEVRKNNMNVIINILFQRNSTSSLPFSKEITVYNEYVFNKDKDKDKFIKFAIPAEPNLIYVFNDKLKYPYMNANY